MVKNLKSYFWLATVMITTIVVGCRSNSNSSRFRLLNSLYSTQPDKSEGLIADSRISSTATTTSTTLTSAKSTTPATENVSLVAYRDMDQQKNDSWKVIREAHIHEAQAPVLLASLANEAVDQASSPSDSLTPPSADQPMDLPASGSGELDLAALEAMAMANNPSLAEQQAIVDSLRGRWVQAGLKPNPTLGFSGLQLFSQGQSEQIGVFLGQRIVRSEKLAADQQIVCREMDVALQNLAAQQQRVLTDVRQRYYELLIAQRRRQVTGELVKIAEESLNKTNSLLEAELGTKIDVLRSTVELQETGIQHETAQNQLNAAWRQLTAVTGQPDMPLQTVRGNIEPEIDLDESTLMQLLIQESPEIAGMIAQRQRAQAQLQRAMVEPLPDVDIQSIVQHDNGTDGTNMNLQVSLPVPLRNRNQGAIAEARSQLAASHYAQHKTELGLQERLAFVWQRYESALVQVKGYSKPDGILNNSRKTLDLIRKAYDAGEIGSLELITAQRIYSQTSLQYLAALSEYWSSKTELEGQLLKGSLQN